MRTILLCLLTVLSGCCGAQIVVSPPPPNATSGQAYSHQFAATGGVAPYTWTAGGLPAGMSINPTTGILSGTSFGIALPNNFSIWVRATDSTSAFGTLSTTLTLVEPSGGSGDSGSGGCSTAEAAGVRTFVWLSLLGYLAVVASIRSVRHNHLGRP